MSNEAQKEKKWGGKTFGTGFMHHWLISLLKYFDVRVVYVLAYLFAVTPTLTKPGYRHAYRFFRYRFGYSPLRSAWMAYKNHCLFAQVVIDKFAMYAGKHFELEMEGYDHFLDLAGRPEGFVQLSSHIGNYEIAGYTLVAEKKSFNALVYSGEKATVMDNRGKLFSNTNIHMIPIREDMSHLFAINEALADGETVSIPADRVWGSKKYVSKNFLGAEAHFPMGPFQVVAMRGVDALAVNVMKTASRRYKVYVTPLAYDKQAPRKVQIEQLATSYVNELERIVRSYPAQWYNYFDFWNQ